MAQPEMTYVDSSNVVAIGYDPDTRELYVEFKGESTYVYSDVPEEAYTELCEADSKGSYLNREIKPNYDYRPV
jgi:hypothetical protein